MVTEETKNDHYEDLDPDKLKAAIMARRDESRELNADWEHADSEGWEADSPSNQ